MSVTENNQDLIKYFQSVSKEEREYLLSVLEPREVEIISKTLNSQLGKEDPSWWIANNFGLTLWDKQKEIVESVLHNQRTSVRSCHGAGKSCVAAATAQWFLHTNENSLVITTAPTHRQVEEVLWGEIRHLHTISQLPGELLRTQLRLADKWRAFGFSTDDPDAFVGHHAPHILVIFDEASGIAPEIWEAAEGVLTGDGARLLSIGNPTDPASKFKEECDSPVTNSFQISAFDCPNLKHFNITEETLSKYSHIEVDKFLAENVTGPLPFPGTGLINPAWVFDKYHRWKPTSPMWKSRVLGEFPDQGSDCLIPIGWIERAVDNDMPNTLPHEFGVDVAWMGGDENVVVERFGACARVIKKFHGMNKSDTLRILTTLVDEKNPEKIKVDSIGYGAAVFDDLAQKYGHNRVVQVNGSQSPTEIVLPGQKRVFMNYRAEVYWSLRERFERNEISLTSADDDLINQLKIIKYEIKNGQIKIEAKEDMRKRLGRSPDYADALAYAFAPDRDGEVPCIGLAEDLYQPSAWKSLR